MNVAFFFIAFMVVVFVAMLVLAALEMFPGT
jgi:hypothetical protein